MHHRYARRLHALDLPLVLPLALLAAPAFGQSTTLPTGTVVAGERDAADIVVSGSYADSLADSARTKRHARYALDAISSTDIGKFPNQNVAEALQIVPGVAITRPRGEGQYVSIRGLGPQFQNTVLNGRQIAVNEFVENGNALGTQFRFEMLPSEFTAQIEVVKTPTADMTEGALGGNINVKTLRPFDVGNSTSLGVRGTYTSLTGRVAPTLTMIRSWTSSDDTLSLLVGGQHLRKYVRNDHLWNFGWNQNVALFRNILGSGVYTPTRTRPTFEHEDRERLSGTLSAQWRPSSDLKTTFDVLATRLDVQYDEAGMDIYPDDTSRIPLGTDRSVNINLPQPSFVAGTADIVGNTAIGGTIDNARFMAARERALNRHDLISVGLDQIWTPGRWILTGDANWSYAHSYFPSLAQATVRSRAAFYAPFAYDASDGYRALPTIAETKSWTDPANYRFMPFQIAYKNSKDQDFNMNVEVARTFDGPLNRITIGGQYHFRKRDYVRQDITVNTLNGQPLASLGSAAYEQPYVDFLSVIGGNAPRNWIAPVTQTVYDALVTSTIVATPRSVNDMGASFRVQSRIYTAYLRADFGNGPVTGNLGARYVHTDQESASTINIATAAQPKAQAVSYPMSLNDLLPSFNLRAELSRTLIARGAVSRVMTRPNVIDNAPRITLANDSPTGTGGNPKLKPFLATQFDTSLEWYFSRHGQLTGAIFYKAMDDYITAQSQTIFVPGRNDAAGNAQPITLSTQINGGSATLYGAEFSYNQVFSFLPQPFDGLGVQATYTRVAVSSDFMTGGLRVRDQLPGLSKSSANAVVFYDKGPFSTRLSYVWRDRYLNAADTSVVAPVYTAAFGSLDGSIAYRATPAITLAVEGTNLANASAYNYADDRYRFAEIANYGRTILFGIRGKL
jgi:iron complex outermembrane receptor protein